MGIDGRDEDYVVTPESGHNMRFDYIFKSTHHVQEAQVVQEKLGGIIVRFVDRDGYYVDEESRIGTLISELVSQAIAVKFEYMEEIEHTARGKFRAVVLKLARRRNLA